MEAAPSWSAATSSTSPLTVVGAAAVLGAVLEDGLVGPVIPTLHLLLRMLTAEADPDPDPPLAEELDATPRILGSVGECHLMAVLVLQQPAVQIAIGLLDRELPVLVENRCTATEGIPADRRRPMTVAKGFNRRPPAAFKRDLEAWTPPRLPIPGVHADTDGGDGKTAGSESAADNGGHGQQRLAEFQREQKMESQFLCVGLLRRSGPGCCCGGYQCNLLFALRRSLFCAALCSLLVPCGVLAAGLNST